MKCEKLRKALPDVLLGDGQVPADARQHLEECPRCQGEWNELQSTMRMLDAWEVPEPSPYFDTRMAVRLREERNAQRSGWLEGLRARLLFSSNLRLRPALTATLALVVIAGAGSYEGFVVTHQPAPQQPAVSATVTDLELLDSNAQTLQQLAAFDDTDASAAQSSGGNMSN
jgi:predicted anti-sigma-YlaC factor YlaD